MLTIPETLEYVKTIHFGQMYSQLPFYVHPILVASKFSGSPILFRIALLHDVLEDGPEDRETHKQRIYQLFGMRITQAVSLLTRPVDPDDDDQVYQKYIVALSRNPDARDVKISDLESNLWSINTLGSIHQNAFERLRPRYEKALDYLIYAKRLKG